VTPWFLLVRYVEFVPVRTWLGSIVGESREG
jgi:hypothetical protein